MAANDTSAVLTQITQFYQTALNWASPVGYGSTGNTGTAVNTGTPFDGAGAAQTTASSSDWFGAMQGSFNSSQNFLNSAFQSQQQFAAPIFNDVIYNTSVIGNQMADAMTMIAKAMKKSAGRGFLSSIF